jgi:ATP-dependent RNA helicase DeaD
MTLAIGVALLTLAQSDVLTPTRELARQVAGVLSALGRGAGISVVPVYGGSSFGSQESALAAGAQVVVGTPGRILAMTPKSRQTSMFSATIPEWVERISARHLVEPEVLVSDTADGSEPDSDHVMVEA